MSRTPTLSLRFAALCLTTLALGWGCATGTPEDDGESEAGTGGDLTGAGGEATGEGGGGGMGLCAMDCASIETAPCQVALCNDGAYPGNVGDCVVVASPDGELCDDGAFCTTGDACVAGVCEGGEANDCGMAAGPCEAILCDEDAESCTATPTGDGEPCSDDLCVEGATCSNGLCLGGQPKDCFFAPVPDDCHVAQCNPANGLCEPEIGNEGQPCSDPADLCTENKVCAAGICSGGSAKDCSSLTTGCTIGTCDGATGQCEAVAANEGSACNDLDACTTAETCTAGSCNGGVPVDYCSLIADGCCPSGCNATNDADCQCPGTIINGVCVYLPAPNTPTSASIAQAVCQGVGTGWGLCSPAMLCNPQTYSYLAGEGCDCAGGSAACACGGAANVYVHVSGGASPYYLRQPEIANCGPPACTNSVTESCGVPLCCKP